MGNQARCTLCGRERWMLDGSDFGVRYCRLCDAVPLGDGRFAGPPSLNFTDANGVFPMRAKGVEE